MVGRETGPDRKGTSLPHRIAYLLEYPTLSGGERSLLTLLERLDPDRYEPLVLAPPEGRLAFAVRERGIPHLPFEVHANGGAAPARPVLASRVARILRSEGADLLHANSLSMSFISGRAAHEAGIPAVGHARDIQRLSRMRIAELCRNSVVLCVSRATADNLMVQGVRSDAVEIVPNAVDPEVFRPDGPGAGLREELMAPAGTPLVGCIGQICLRKGQNVLLSAFARVLQKIPEAILVIAGERHSQKAESQAFEEDLHRFVRARRLDRNVVFLGYRDDVPALLRELDLLAHAAHQEPLGRVLLEAAATGVPVVATGVGGTREIVVHRETGVVVPPGKPGAIARAITSLLRDDARRRELGNRARDHAREHFSPRLHAERVEAVYGRLLGGNGAA